jgi:7-cyano-7-deazaguanine synthase
MKTIAIVSGGMDSVTMAHYLKFQLRHELHLLSFNYGQRHKKELLFARNVALHLNVPFDVIDLSSISPFLDNNALLDPSGIDVPEGHYEAESMKATVVPNRNAIMISIATGVAVAEKADCVATGVHAGDHAIYPDCRPQFIFAMNDAMAIGNEGFANEDFGLIAPFVNATKLDIAELGRDLNVDYRLTWSCYNGRDQHCGKCGTCVERHEALEGAFGVGNDPTVYEDA